MLQNLDSFSHSSRLGCHIQTSRLDLGTTRRCIPSRTQEQARITRKQTPFCFKISKDEPSRLPFLVSFLNLNYNNWNLYCGRTELDQRLPATK